MRFFWRILLSIWASVLLFAGLSLWAANLLFDQDPSLLGTGLPNQVVKHFVAELERQLREQGPEALEQTFRTHAEDFEPAQRFFLFNERGQELLDRSMPPDLARGLAELKSTPQPNPAGHFQTLQLHRFEGTGYELVSQIQLVPLAQKLLRLRALAFVLLSILASYLLTRFIVRPVHQLQRAGQQVAQGDLSVRVAHTLGNRTDEIAQLARDFDAMTERVEVLLNAQQRLMRDVSHELRSPLARLQALLSIARQQDPAPAPDQLDRMENELERLDKLIGEILSYARLEGSPPLDRRPTDLVDLLENVVDDASIEAQATGKKLSLEAPERLLLAVDGALLQRAVENIVRNAIEHTAPDTTVALTVTRTATGAQIDVSDQGSGVPEANLERIFEPFFREDSTRSKRTGTGGIGLAIAKRGVELHGGQLKAANQAGGGLRVTLALPDSFHTASP